MDQADLKPADLIPYLGSRSRVSEILSGKRQLTLEMIRALSGGLGIPAKILIQKPLQPESQNWDTALVKKMEKQGYFGEKTLKKYDKSELISSFFEAFSNLQPAALYRKTSFRSAPRTDKNALLVWGLRVLQKAEKIKTPVKYQKGKIDLKFMQDVVRLSAKDNGPLLARDYLNKHGIKLIIEPHLPKTHLDGATFFKDKDYPVIGLTVRHDRPDNFWFTLMHELAHIALHYDNGTVYFYDEKIQENDGVEIDNREKDADELAEESILPKGKWETSAAKRTPNQFSTKDLASELGVQDAVIAGMIRFKHNKFYYLNEMIHDENIKIRKQYFPEEFKE
jgi:HTH-type transcriptional regulator/antitoxin HigA